MQSAGEFARWRDEFRRKLTDRFGAEFTVEAVGVLDADSDAFGEDLARDRLFLEAIVPATVLARREHDRG